MSQTMQRPCSTQTVEALHCARRLLLIATREIGDVLLTTPLLHSLRCACPTADIDVLTFSGRDSILHGNPDCNRILTIDPRPDKTAHQQLLKQLWRRYDVAISTLAGDRPLLYSLIAAPRRVSLVPPKSAQSLWKRWLLHGWSELDDVNTHTVIQNLRLADVLGLPRYYALRLPQTVEAARQINAVLPFDYQQTPYAVLHPVPRWVYKRWTLNGWQQLAQMLDANGFRVVLTGGHDEDEQVYLREVMTGMPINTINVAGQLSFAAVSHLLQQAQVYIGTDTAVTHLAAATGVATVAVFGPTNPVKWSPWPYGFCADRAPFIRRGTQRVNNVLLVQGEGDCVPCHQEGCERHRASHSTCLDTLAAEAVISAVQQMLAG